MVDEKRPMTVEELRKIISETPERFLVQVNMPEANIDSSIVALFDTMRFDYARLRQASSALSDQYYHLQKEKKRLATWLSQLVEHIRSNDWYAAARLVDEIERWSN